MFEAMKKGAKQERKEQIFNDVMAILSLKATDRKTAGIVASYIERVSAEIFATGKAAAYREMFDVIRELADRKKTEELYEKASAGISEYADKTP